LCPGGVRRNLHLEPREGIRAQDGDESAIDLPESILASTDDDADAAHDAARPRVTAHVGQ
jgi:hypothetical protein